MTDYPDLPAYEECRALAIKARDHWQRRLETEETDKFRARYQALMAYHEREIARWNALIAQQEAQTC
jgi:hypothetical protein